VLGVAAGGATHINKSALNYLAFVVRTVCEESEG
jgi:hypothetical protein